jgi:acyl carrier protein
MGKKHMNIRNIITTTIKDIMEQRGKAVLGDIVDDAILLESGLDSLGYAIVVTILDEELGYDPFYEMKEPTYPTTLKEFVDIYEKFKHLAKN